jgi:hypothetical protein
LVSGEWQAGRRKLNKVPTAQERDATMMNRVQMPGTKKKRLKKEKTRN